MKRLMLYIICYFYAYFFSKHSTFYLIHFYTSLESTEF